MVVRLVVDDGDPEAIAAFGGHGSPAASGLHDEIAAHLTQADDQQVGWTEGSRAVFIERGVLAGDSVGAPRCAALKYSSRNELQPRMATPSCLSKPPSLSLEM